MLSIACSQGWFDALRLEVTTKNITVTVVHPGPVNTPFQPKALTGDITLVGWQ